MGLRTSARPPEALAADLPALWSASSTSDKDRKRLLRTLVADVTLTSQAKGDELRIGLRWRSGASELIVDLERANRDQLGCSLAGRDASHFSE